MKRSPLPRYVTAKLDGLLIRSGQHPLPLQSVFVQS
jgi:hypothetical protein